MLFCFNLDRNLFDSIVVTDLIVFCAIVVLFFFSMVLLRVRVDTLPLFVFCAVVHYCYK